MKRPDRLVAGVGMLLVGVLLAGATIFAVSQMSEQLRTTREQVNDLAAAYDTARQTGPDPDLPTAEEITGGEAPVPGPPGRDGRDGRDGRNGADATAGMVGAAVDGYMARFPLVDQPDPDDPEIQDPEQQDNEIQDPEIDDPEVQDDEIQDPEIDDPDPNGTACPDGYSLQPDTIRGDEVLVCTRNPEPAP